MNKNTTVKGTALRNQRRETHPPEIKEGIAHEAVITILAPAEKVYAYWRNLENLPSFMKHLASIEIIGPTRSRWKWRAIKDQVTLEWESEITDEVPNALIAWRSTEGATVAHTGEVFFDELSHGRGTEVHVSVRYQPPGGKVTDFLEKVLGESPDITLKEDIRRLREIIEVGTIPTTEGQPRGGMEEIPNPALHRNR
jgi:uncharacterized membrane protein